ncbi:hypothetical protein KEJ39_09370 [Candidatus Bathyarchaeota archaeon]|nr:hypothetical protein [Candidatus Bathyarchaeota archaeon]
MESSKIQDLYLSLVEKSRDLADLEENVKIAVADAKSRGDHRLAETMAALNGKVRETVQARLR